MSPPVKQLLENVIIATMTDGQPYGLIEDGAILIEDGAIAWIGLRREAPACPDTYDCGERVMTPGLIDCHTHVIYGGNRANEFEMRLNGASYQEIAEAGGGIMATVKATRESDPRELWVDAIPRLETLLDEGVTTVEIKSGYGLDVETELKMLRVARKLGEFGRFDVVTSYLGAHAIPPEFKNDRQGYINLIVEQVLPAVVAEGLADAVDGFCEGIALTVDETERVFRAAKLLDLPVKLHAEQLSNLGGAKMAARFNALSVDHIEYLDEEGVDAIAEAGTAAVLLPGAFYYLRETQKPPVELLRARGVPIAVATDLNPGSSPVNSLLTAMNMACVLFEMTPEEVLRGVTSHAAGALGLKDRGTIEVGKKADLVLWDVKRPGELTYQLGFNPTAAICWNGEWVEELA